MLLLILLFLLIGPGLHSQETIPLHVVSAENNSSSTREVLWEHLGHMLPHAVRRSMQEAAATADDGKESLETICKAVENSFVDQSVDCQCLGILGGSFIMNCEYAQEVCSQTSTSTTCGRPQIGVSLVDGSIFSSTTCMKDYRRGMLPMADTCVFVDACAAEDDGLCGCTASYGGAICGSCQICPGGHALSVDCTNVNVEAITKECQAVDLDLHLDAGASNMSGFAPNFSGFCSELESALENRISCDCSDAVGGTFSLTCKTNEAVCTGNICGDVESTLSVVEGHKDSLSSCVRHQTPPFLGGLSCTTLKLGERDTIDGCYATFDGKACDDCQVCGSKKAITLDCRNVHADAWLPRCQDVNVTSSYEFIPQFPGALLQVKQDEPKKPQSGAEASAAKLSLVIFFFMIAMR